MAQKPPKSSQKFPFFLVRETLKTSNLTTTNAITMKLTTIVYHQENFHLTKDLGVAQRCSGGVAGKPVKKCQKMGFFGSIFRISKTISKTVTYMILCHALHRWWKFCANWTWFGDVIHEKPPENSLKCLFLLVPEILKIYNLRTANAMKMKLTRVVYLYETFHLTKDFGASFRAWQGLA